MRSKIVEKILRETPLSIRLKVSNEMAFIMLLTKLGYREDKMWDERDEKEMKILHELCVFAEEHTNHQMNTIKKYVEEHGSIDDPKITDGE